MIDAEGFHKRSIREPTSLKGFEFETQKGALWTDNSKGRR
jgi:hypothetical protein